MSLISEPCNKQRGGGRPWLLEARSSQTFILVTVSLSLFTDMFLYGMIIPVMPDALVIRAGVPFEDREYWISVMLMSQAATAFICAPIFGYLIDRTGRTKYLYLFGLIMLTLSMLGYTFAHSLLWYIVARIPQGAAMSMVFVAGLTLLIESIPKENMGYYFGYLDIFLALGLITGPLLGGVVYHLAGYNAVFGMALVLLGIDLILRFAMISKSEAAPWLETPVIDQNDGVEDTSSAGYGCIVDGVQHVNNLPGEKFTLGKLLQNPRVVSSAAAILVFSLVMAAFDTMLPVFVVDHFNWDSLGAGLIFAPVAVTVLLGPLFGYLSDRFGARITAFLGFSLATPCLFCLRIIQQDKIEQKVALCVLLSLTGTCLNAVSPAVMAEMQNAIFELEDKTPGIFGKHGAIGRVCSLQQMAQCIGFTLGPVLGGFIDHRYGWEVTSIVLGAITAVAAVPMLWLSGPSAEKQEGSDILEEREPLLKSSSVQSSSVPSNEGSSSCTKSMTPFIETPLSLPAGHRIETAASRPDLWHPTHEDPTHELFVFEAWGNVDIMKRHYRRLGDINELARYQTMIVRNSDEKVIALGACTPFFWPELATASQCSLDASELPRCASTLPDGGWETILARGVLQARSRQGERPSSRTTSLTEDQQNDEAIAWRRDRPNALSGLLVVVADSYRGRHVADILLMKFKDLARQYCLQALVIPLRPTKKARYPHVSFDEYFTWIQGKPYQSGFTWPSSNNPGSPLPFDPWLRKHIRMGAIAVKPAVRSCTVVASAEDWQQRLGDKLILDVHIDKNGKRCVVGDKLDGFILKDEEQSTPFQWDSVRQVGTYTETDMWVWHKL